MLFVDTGFHFPETLRFCDQVAEQPGLNLRILRAEAPPESATAQPLYRTNPDLCCELRKVQPVQQTMREYRGWISGIRRDQSAVRAQAQVIEPGRHGGRPLGPYSCAKDQGEHGRWSPREFFASPMDCPVMFSLSAKVSASYAFTTAIRVRSCNPASSGYAWSYIIDTRSAVHGALVR